MDVDLRGRRRCGYDRCARAGLDTLQPPEDKPWGVREFGLRHPDGHVLRIGTGTGE
jgi:hypothetical protein